MKQIFYIKPKGTSVKKPKSLQKLEAKDKGTKENITDVVTPQTLKDRFAQHKRVSTNSAVFNH